MTERIFRAKSWVTLLVVAAASFLLAPRASAEPKPDPKDRMVAQMVCEFLQRGHLNKPEIGEEVSRRLMRRFLKDMDPAKLYFTKADIDEFKKQETDLASSVLKGDLTFAYKVYAKYVERVAERVKLVEELVEAKHDFTVNESMSTDFDAMDYCASDEAIKERWRKRIKFDLLMQRMGDKPVPEAEAKQKVLDRYKGALKRAKQLDNTDLVEVYLGSLTTCVDPHTNYMSPATLDDFEIAMRLNLDGIGAVLRSENGHAIIVEVVAGGAAADDGRLKPNDKIVAVAQGDDKFVDAVDMKLRDVVKMVRGQRGTKVQLKVIPNGKVEPVVYELTRRKIEMKSQEARAEIVEDGKKADGTAYRIGVIDLPSFYTDFGKTKDPKSATEDVRKLLKGFEEKKVDAVVLDLRHNGGGSLQEALALTGLFIDHGPIVQVKDSAGRVRRLDDPESGTVYGGPLVVLTSRLSASASEILAGALQDYGRALIVGDVATHGKGTVQTVIELGNQIPGDNPPKLGAIKLTVQQFYRVNGDSTQVRGVAADVVIPSLTEVQGIGEKELDFALAFDKVKSADHADVGLVTPELKTVLKDRSEKRIKESAEFTKLAKEIAQFKARKAAKSLPLNEKELKEQFGKDGVDKLDPNINEIPETSEKGAYKFKRNFTNSEVLKITEDFIQGKKLVSQR
jgi:carboxyl-terminal processing protease